MQAAERGQEPLTGMHAVEASLVDPDVSFWNAASAQAEDPNFWNKMADMAETLGLSSAERRNIKRLQKGDINKVDALQVLGRIDDKVTEYRDGRAEREAAQQNREVAA